MGTQVLRTVGLLAGVASVSFVIILGIAVMRRDPELAERSYSVLATLFAIVLAGFLLGLWAISRLSPEARKVWWRRVMLLGPFATVWFLCSLPSDRQ